MTPLHPDRLTTESAAPAPSSRRTRAVREGAARLAGHASGAREVTARTAGMARVATVAAARTAAGAAKAAGAKAAAVRTAAARRKTATSSAPTATEAGVPSAPPVTVEPARPEPAAAQVAVVPRPTPHRRPPVPAEPVAAVAEQRSRSWLRSTVASGRRRPALCVAAALAGALSLSAAAAGQTPAVAESGAVHESISVADALGVEAAEARPIVSVEATDRLGELVASRAERDEEEAQAAEAQAEADQEAREEARRAAVAAAEAARPDAVLPVEGARYTSGFGERWGTLHGGIDLAAPMRTPEYAVLDGVVLEAGPASGFGLAVYIQHENGDVTVYGHMDEILVTAGQVVRAGDTIALLGNRGQSTGPHLHFEVHEGGIDGTRIDPVPWLAARGVKV